jgi:electron transport complex protein RnfC
MIHPDAQKVKDGQFYRQRYVPQTLVVPLSQHIGAKPEPLVQKGQQVTVGECIAKAKAFMSADVHTPVTGIVEDIRLCPHPMLGKDTAVIIKKTSDEEYKAKERRVSLLSTEELIAAVHDAGIVGLGGAGFPTHVKLKPTKEIDTLVVNGCECEPYLSSDEMTMIDHADQMLEGVSVIARILGVSRVVIVIEDDKPDAVTRINSKLHTKKYPFLPKNTSVVQVPAGYPHGAEKQLVYTATKRVVPAGGLPADVACAVQNVTTCEAVYDAVYRARPLLEKTVTFGGDALVQSANIRLCVGTRISDLIADGVIAFKKQPRKVVFGGPMMGRPVSSLDVPIIKTTSGVLFLSDDVCDAKEETPCIRCARCIDACPMRLMPNEFARSYKAKAYARLSEFWVNDCIECGSCAYVCPAKIPLVGYIKAGKNELRKNKPK